MVQDFKHLGWFKNFIDDVLDHKFIMDIKDPLITEELNLIFDSGEIINEMIHEMPEGYKIINMGLLNKRASKFHSKPLNFYTAITEKYEGFVLVDFVPTSENLSSWLLSVVQNKMKDIKGVEVQAIEYWETPKSHCRVES